VLCQELESAEHRTCCLSASGLPVLVVVQREEYNRLSNLNRLCRLNIQDHALRASSSGRCLMPLSLK
jgi:hypothetical protein